MRPALLVLALLSAALPARGETASIAGVRGEPSAAAPPARQIVQQRTADGRVVFTDRPLAGARIERSWTLTPEDPALGDARREAARIESNAVTERIARQLEQQRERDTDLDIARERTARAEAERDAARARMPAEPDRAIVVWPRRAFAPPHRPAPQPAMRAPRQPGPVIPPRPGATPPPRPPSSHGEPDTPG